jgi:hypothetical protein
MCAQALDGVFQAMTVIAAVSRGRFGIACGAHSARACAPQHSSGFTLWLPRLGACPDAVIFSYQMLACSSHHDFPFSPGAATPAMTYATIPHDVDDTAALAVLDNLRRGEPLIGLVDRAKGY